MAQPQLKHQVSHHISLDESAMTHLSKEDQDMLKSLDTVGAGKITLAEILAEVHKCKDTNKNMSRLFKVFGVAVLTLVILLGGNTAATFAVVESTKENHVKGDNLVSAADGGTTQTANSDMAVDANGKLATKANARRLDGKGAALKTAPSLEKVELASSLPDKTLMGLDEITVYSDKGHTLQIQVNGFSRVPVLNSNCGNVVNFYTAWKGRITLDSKDLSFDPVTAKEFENAGFTVAIGGLGGRRLAGKSKTDGFFKNMEDMAASGKWKCAGVPLPSMTAQNIVKQSNYQPCGAKADPAVRRNKLDMCDSRFGGQVLGAAQLDKDLSMAVVSKTKAIAAQLKKETPEAIYVKTQATLMKSETYNVVIESYPAHFTQELISITNIKTNKGVKFQNVKDKGRTHCADLADPATKNVQGAKNDKNTDSDTHFEFLGTNEENGKVLRHFRIMTSDAFNTYMGAGGQKPTDSYTEFWDVADTLVPYRMLSGDGSLAVFESIITKCSDADVKTELNKRVSGDIANLFTCTDAEKDTATRPEMAAPYLDLSVADADYYVQHVFKTEDDMDDVVKVNTDTSEKARFGRYLTKVKDLSAMPDMCKEHCKKAWNAYQFDFNNQADVCIKSLPELLICLQSSQMVPCETAPLVANQRTECNPNGTPLPTSRRLEGEDESAELVFNESSSDVVPLKSRNMISTKCTSKMGAVTWMGDGWCMKWKFDRFGFSLQLKFGNVGGHLGVSISATACVPIEKIFGIPPPLVCKKCAGGSISVSTKPACPKIPLSISGKVTMSVGVHFSLGIVSFTLAKIEIGLEAAVATYKKEAHCWWNCGNGGGRRRWWRRRRSSRACNYADDCDVKIAAFAEVTITLGKGRFDVTFWVSKKEMVCALTLSAFEFWKGPWGGWKSVWSNVVFKYKF